MPIWGHRNRDEGEMPGLRWPPLHPTWRLGRQGHTWSSVAGNVDRRLRNAGWSGSAGLGRQLATSIRLMTPIPDRVGETFQQQVHRPHGSRSWNCWWPQVAAEGSALGLWAGLPPLGASEG